MKHILSLGAGVQSSVVLLMSIRGDLPKFDAAIFADVGWEPQEVYRHLAWLEVESMLAGIPVIRVSKGNLRADAMISHVRGLKTDGKRWASMPMYMLAPDGSIGMIRRQCTNEYKIAPIEAKIRELANVKPRSRPKDIRVEQYFGISIDEFQRTRESAKSWIRNQYPLCDMRMTRFDCVEWLEKNGYPPAPRSACIGCPFHSDSEWQRIKNDPVQWADAVEFDDAIRNCGGMRGQMFLHRSCRPLSEIDFRSIDEKNEQNFFAWNECTGSCGV